MIHIHDNEVNKIAECNLLHNIINHPRGNKILNIHYSRTLHGCMNTRHGREKFKNFRNILYIVCSSTIVMGGLVEKLHPKNDAMMQWHTQAVNITTNHNIKVDFTLPILNATNAVTWKLHVDELAKCGYDMILEQDILTELGLNLKLSENIIKADGVTFKGYTAPMVDLGTYTFKYLNTVKITPEESFTNTYTENLYDSEHVCTAKKLLLVILYAKNEKADLYKVMETQYKHLTMTQHN